MYAVAVTIRDEAVEAWLTELASRSPAPGGGAAAALCAATAAGLVGMVTAYTTGPKWADRQARMQLLNGQAARLRADALALADDDAAAFSAVGAAYGMPSQTQEQQAARRGAIQQALIGAAGPPERTGRLAAAVLEMARELVDQSNPNVLSDVAAAAAAARAALECAIVNIEINVRQIRDEAEAARLRSVVGDLEQAIDEGGRVAGDVRARLRS
jgi:formiminotetrahydrofolate cyclodeaminase